MQEKLNKDILYKSATPMKLNNHTKKQTKNIQLSMLNNQYSMLTPTTLCKTPLPLWLKNIEQGTRND